MGDGRQGTGDGRQGTAQRRGHTGAEGAAWKTKRPPGRAACVVSKLMRASVARDGANRRERGEGMGSLVHRGEGWRLGLGLSRGERWRVNGVAGPSQSAAGEVAKVECPLRRLNHLPMTRIALIQVRCSSRACGTLNAQHSTLNAQRPTPARVGVGLFT